jgi:hypothetical protein
VRYAESGMASLDGCKLKLQRAKEHLRQLHVAVNEFHKSGAYSVQIDHDRQPGTVYGILRITGEPSPLIGAIAGDAIHNLRSALDHLACELVIANGGTVTSRTQFPIFADSAKFAVSAGAQIHGAADLTRVAIERIQPYTRPPAEEHPLWLIHRLDIEDKHKTLLVVAGRGESLELKTDQGENLPVRWAESLPFPLKDKTVLFQTAPSLMPRADVKVQVRFAIEVALHEPGSANTASIVPLVHDLIESTENVVSAFESEFF